MMILLEKLGPTTYWVSCFYRLRKRRAPGRLTVNDYLKRITIQFSSLSHFVYLSVAENSNSNILYVSNNVIWILKRYFSIALFKNNDVLAILNRRKRLLVVSNARVQTRESEWRKGFARVDFDLPV